MSYTKPSKQIKVDKFDNDLDLWAYLETLAKDEPASKYGGWQESVPTGYKDKAKGEMNEGSAWWSTFRQGGMVKSVTGFVYSGNELQLPLTTVSKYDLRPTQTFVGAHRMMAILEQRPLNGVLGSRGLGFAADNIAIEALDAMPEKQLRDLVYMLEVAGMNDIWVVARSSKLYVINGTHRWALNMMRSTVTHLNVRLLPESVELVEPYELLEGTLSEDGKYCGNWLLGD
jgi:hypothetical protein